METQTWKVKRWSGRDQEPVRTVFQGDETKARAKYTTLRDALRQGMVKLIGPDGTTVDKVVAFRNRTRW